MTTKKPPTERKGWGSAWESHRFHYFVLIGKEKTSTCGNYLFRKWLKKARNDMNGAGPNDCAECWEVVKVKMR